MALPSYNTSIITAVGRVEQGMAFPKFVIGGKGGSGGTTYTLFKKGSTYTFAVWRSEVFKIGQAFSIRRIRIPLSAAVAANMTVIPVVKIDDEATSAIGTTINNTNYANSEKLIEMTPDNFSHALNGEKNFYLELQFSGSALVGVTFPITYEVELLEKA